jgi:hypothetical protein
MPSTLRGKITPKIAPNPCFVIMDPSVLSLKKIEKKIASSLIYMEIIPMK